MRVVDGLERVEVEVQQRHRRPGAVGVPQVLAPEEVEAAPVVQPGDGVLQRQ